MDEEKSLETALAEAFRQADALEGPLDERLRFYLGESRKLLPDLESTYDRLVERIRPNAAANRVPAIGGKLPGFFLTDTEGHLVDLCWRRGLSSSASIAARGATIAGSNCGRSPALIPLLPRRAAMSFRSCRRRRHTPRP